MIDEKKHPKAAQLQRLRIARAEEQERQKKERKRRRLEFIENRQGKPRDVEDE
jgi:hypothetical protein